MTPIIGNVVAVKDRGSVKGKPYTEPWQVTIVTDREPRKFSRYALIPLSELQTLEIGEALGAFVNGLIQAREDINEDVDEDAG